MIISPMSLFWIFGAIISLLAGLAIWSYIISTAPLKQHFPKTQRKKFKEKDILIINMRRFCNFVLFLIFLFIFTSAVFAEGFASPTKNSVNLQCSIGTETEIKWDVTYKEPMTFYISGNDCTFKLNNDLSNHRFILKRTPSSEAKNITITCIYTSNPLDKRLIVTKQLIDFNTLTQIGYFHISNCNIDAAKVAVNTKIIDVNRVSEFEMRDVNVLYSRTIVEVSDTDTVKIIGFPATSMPFFDVFFDFKAVNKISVNGVNLKGGVLAKNYSNFNFAGNKVTSIIAEGAPVILETSNTDASFTILDNTFSDLVGTPIAIAIMLNENNGTLKNNAYSPDFSSNVFLGKDKEFLNSMTETELEEFINKVTFENDTPTAIIDLEFNCDSTIFDETVGNNPCPNIGCRAVSCKTIPELGKKYCEYNILPNTQPNCSKEECAPPEDYCTPIGKGQNCKNVNECPPSTDAKYPQSSCEMQEENKVCKYYREGCVLNVIECLTNEHCNENEDCIENKCISNTEFQKDCFPMGLDIDCTTTADCPDNPNYPEKLCIVTIALQKKCAYYESGCVCTPTQCQEQCGGSGVGEGTKQPAPIPETHPLLIIALLLGIVFILNKSRK